MIQISIKSGISYLIISKYLKQLNNKKIIIKKRDTNKFLNVIKKKFDKRDNFLFYLRNVYS
jgi:hypothetical protein